MMKKNVSWLIACIASAGIWTRAAAAQERHHPHHDFPRDVDAFHSVLAPIWHSQPGKGRTLAACAQAGEMDAAARNIRSTDASRLVAAVATLKQKCQGNRSEADAALVEVHEAFHRLIEQRPAVPPR